MAVKPPQVCSIQKNKLMGAQVGFADTFNWLASCAENMKGGKGCEVKRMWTGHPEVDVKIQPGDGIDVQCGGPGQPYTISLVEPYQEGMVDLSVNGTDNTTAVPLSGAFQLSAMPDTNLSITCYDNVINIGVYWI